MPCAMGCTLLNLLNTDISASSEESVVILEPKPTTDPNDPLVSTDKQPL